MIKITLPDFDKVVKEVSQEVFDRVKERTPVLTGRARDGWEIVQGDKQSKISNDVPYIGVLESGSSDQAPQGFVGITLDEVPEMIKQAIEKNQKTL